MLDPSVIRFPPLDPSGPPYPASSLATAATSRLCRLIRNKIATRINASPATPPRTPPRRLGLTGGLLFPGGISVAAGGAATGLLVAATDPPPTPPTTSVVAVKSVKIDEVFVLFDDVDESVELLPVRVDPPAPVVNARINTVPSMVVVIAVLATRKRLVPQGAYTRWTQCDSLNEVPLFLNDRDGQEDVTAAEGPVLEF